MRFYLVGAQAMMQTIFAVATIVSHQSAPSALLGSVIITGAVLASLLIIHRIDA